MVYYCCLHRAHNGAAVWYDAIKTKVKKRYMKENKKELIKLISKIAVALAVFVFVLINYKKLVNIDVREIVSAAPSLLPAVLSVLAVYFVKGLVLVIPASLVYISVGMAFSPMTAVLVNIAGILVEFTASYLFGLFLGGDYINKMMQKQKYGKKILEMQENKKDASVFLMRFITVFPLDFVSLFLGSSKYNFGKYILFSFLGLAPRVILFTILGDKIYDYIPMKLIMTVCLFAIPVIVIAVIIKNVADKKRKKNESTENAADKAETK